MWKKNPQNTKCAVEDLTVQVATAQTTKIDQPIHKFLTPSPSGIIICTSPKNFHNPQTRLASFKRKEKQKKETGLLTGN